MMERDTAQRRAIRDAFADAGRPLSPAEVLQIARSIVPSLGMATIYRNLRALCDEGWLVTVNLPGQPPRYERAGKKHHHHFMCRACDRLLEIDGCPTNLKALVPDGFRLERHEVLLYGLCSACGD